MSLLAKAGHHVTYQSTKKSSYKKALEKSTDLVLTAGGDGTSAKVACRLIGTGIPFSVLPLGTANNLARSLGFIASPEEIRLDLRVERNGRSMSASRVGRGANAIFLKASAVVCSRTMFAPRKVRERKPRSLPRNRR